MSFDLDQECRHAKERLRVSIEANTDYELKQMRKKYAGITWKANAKAQDEFPYEYYRGLLNAQQNLRWNGPQYSAYGLGALGNCFGV